MRSIWAGSVSFGLINIPIKIFSAVEESSLDMDMPDKKGHGNIKFKRANSNGQRSRFCQICSAFF
ncbi:hypothetical protein [Flavobacterium sp. LPB0248]|uniref:hypothetical protein n=1 Tax=Flavobacterium sp. LPB0248 TaxID=2614441 RepID=UPI00210364B4|nr:hypothetical protein [Flavobacterium sp. LPB0248]